MSNLPSLIARVLLSWVVVCAAGFVGGRTAIDWLLPLLSVVSENASPDYGATLRWDEHEPSMLLLRASFLEPTPTLSALGVTPGSVAESGSHLEHILVPPAVLLAVVFAWPMKHWRQRMALFASAIPAAVLAVALTTPLLLAGKIDMMLQERAAAAHIALPEPLSLRWMLFAEGGGRWLLPLLLALLCVVFIDWSMRPPLPPAHRTLNP